MKSGVRHSQLYMSTINMSSTHGSEQIFVLCSDNDFFNLHIKVVNQSLKQRYPHKSLTQR